jgi:hypothetical protein
MMFSSLYRVIQIRLKKIVFDLLFFSMSSIRVHLQSYKFVGHFSGVSQTFWEEYVQPESMSVDTLGVYCITKNH